MCVLSTSVGVCDERRELESVLCQLSAARHDKTGYISCVSEEARDVKIKRREVLALRGYENHVVVGEDARQIMGVYVTRIETGSSRGGKKEREVFSRLRGYGGDRRVSGRRGASEQF